MRYKLYFFLFSLLLSAGLFAQQPDNRHIRIVDTLSTQEKATRNPIILKTELDSLVKQFNASQPQRVITESANERADNKDQYILGGIACRYHITWLYYLFILPPSAENKQSYRRLE